jgi:hypothetical protein
MARSNPDRLAATAAERGGGLVLKAAMRASL